MAGNSAQADGDISNMDTNLSTSVHPTSQDDASTSTATWCPSHDELVTLVEVVPSLAGNSKVLPPLVQAAVAGSAGDVRRYLQEGGCLWARDTVGRTPLHWAAGVGSDRLVGALLALGAEWGARDSRGNTPLHHAAEGDSAAALEILLKAQARNVTKDYEQRTPLMCAAFVGDASFGKLLTGDGLELNLVDATNHQRQTALHLAALTGRVAAVSALVAHGASVNAVDVRGRVPLHCALDFYSRFRQPPLLASYWLQYTDWKLEAYGEVAAEATRQMVVHLLTGLDAAKSTCHRDKMEETPLIWALQLRLSTVARLIIDAHPPDRRTDECGMTIMHWAASKGDTYIVNRLLEPHFSPWRRDWKGYTSLMAAVESRDVGTVRALAKCGNFISQKNKMGKTALHIAVDLRDAVMVQCLLDLGVAVGVVDRYRRTALFCALEMGEAGREIAQILMQVGDHHSQRRDRRGRTLLHAAAAGGDAEMVRHVLQRYTYNMSVDNAGESPLSCALRLRHRAAAAELLQSPFRVLGDWDWRTPLHWAAAAGWREEARILHQAGCRADARDRVDWRSPIDAAAINGHLELARELFQWTYPYNRPPPPSKCIHQKYSSSGSRGVKHAMVDAVNGLCVQTDALYM